MLKIPCELDLALSYIYFHNIPLCVLGFQGLEVGDLILKFGSVTLQNFQDMSNIATVVQHSKDVRFLNIIYNVRFLIRAQPSKMREPYSNHFVCQSVRLSLSLSIHTLF